MATIKKTKKSTAKQTQPVIGAGILRPAMVYQYRVHFNVCGKEHPELTRELVRINHDLMTKTGQFTIQLPLIGNGVERALYLMCGNHDVSIVIEYMDGNNNVGHSVAFTEVTVQRCATICDYAANGIAQYIVDFTFKNITTTSAVSGTETILTL